LIEGRHLLLRRAVDLGHTADGGAAVIDHAATPVADAQDDLIGCARRAQAGHAARQIGCKIAGFVGSACVIEQQREHAKTLRGTPEKGELRRASTELRC
jgi:hypothetical protein